MIGLAEPGRSGYRVDGRTLRTRPGSRATWVATIGSLGVLLVAGWFAAIASSPSSASAAPTSVHPRLAALSPLRYGHHLDCDGMYWSTSYWARYVPSYCYGHDEPTMSYQSTAAGSGANASFQIVLPSDTSSYAQGDFYAAFWFGGVVYDTASTGGGNQAFLELQFYPAGPYYTGAGSGSKDCLPNGGYFPSFSAGSNVWFSCAIVWQLATSGSSVIEDAAIAVPIDVGSSSAILVMGSGDHLFVNYTGIAQSTTVPWNISISDTSSGAGGYSLLKNGSLVLSPYYSTAAAGNTLKWGASNPGEIAFSYEIGHAYNVGGSCTPGDGACDSYWPGRWAASGQVQLSLPQLGSPGATTYPSQIAMSSSQGGEYEVNSSSCGSPSTSTSKNCLYPYYEYRAAFHSFDFSTSKLANDTHDYGGAYQFPSTGNGFGQWAANVQNAPWGTVRFLVYPANATTSFNAPGTFSPISINASHGALGQFMEGQYWLNVTAPGCTSSTSPTYLSAGLVLNLTVTLACGGSNLVAHAAATPLVGTAPLNVSFNGTGTGGLSPYSYSWNFGDGAVSSLKSPTHLYKRPGHFAVSLVVADSNGSGSLATLTISAQTPTCSGIHRAIPLAVYQFCHLNKTQQAIFTFNVTKVDWQSNAELQVDLLQGAVNGTSPVFKVGVGIGGTPSMAAAKHVASGPNIQFAILLFKHSLNKFGGWGTYWAVVDAVGGSGGFCFVAGYVNGSLGNGPTCSKYVASPRSTGSASPSAPRPGLPGPTPVDARVAGSLPPGYHQGAASPIVTPELIGLKPTGRPVTGSSAGVGRADPR